MIIPQQQFHLALLASGDAVYVGTSAYTRKHDFFGGDAGIAADRYTPITKQTQHAESVQNSFVDSVSGQVAEALKVRLTFELKRPSNCCLKIYAFAFREGIDLV